MQCGLVNYATGGNQQQYQIPIKVDYTFNAKHSMFARYMLSNNDTPLFYDPSNPLFTGSTTGQKNNIHSVVLGETWVVNAKIVSSTHIAMNRGVNPRFIPAFKTPADFGIPISSFIPAQMNLSVTNGFNLAGGASNPGLLQHPGLLRLRGPDDHQGQAPDGRWARSTSAPTCTRRIRAA